MHPDREIREAFQRLQDAICQWNRSTDRDSILIFREADRNIAQHGPQPSAVTLRWDNGIPVDPANIGFSDQMLLDRFTDCRGKHPGA